jgi:membrane protease YdiL (CAAX protease family)
MNITVNILFPYITLALLVMSLFYVRSYAILRIFIGIQIVIAYFYHLINPIGLLSIIVFWGVCELHWRYPTVNRILNFFRMAAVVTIALAFANHIIPGFYNLKLFNAIQFSPESRFFTMYLNMDKTLAAVILVMTSGLILKNTSPFNFNTLIITLKVSVLCIATLLSLALLSGFIAFDPKFPIQSWLWILNNLLFVCFAEEVIFRGIIQQYLTQLMRRWNLPAILAILLTSILFATLLLGHLNGGLTYIIFSIIAGLFYGYVYYKTNRIEAAIVVHFLVNLSHFLFFTYPAAI